MTQRSSLLARAVACVALGAALLAPGASSAGTGMKQSLLQEGSLGASAALASLVYAPAKLLYALGGLTLGGVSFLWTWGDKKTAKTVVRMSIGGDYVITPEHLLGRESVNFTGG